jgi:hypothetical protein
MGFLNTPIILKGNGKSGIICDVSYDGFTVLSATVLVDQTLYTYTNVDGEILTDKIDLKQSSGGGGVEILRDDNFPNKISSETYRTLYDGVMDGGKSVKPIAVQSMMDGSIGICYLASSSAPISIYIVSGTKIYQYGFLVGYVETDDEGMPTYYLPKIIDLESAGSSSGGSKLYKHEIYIRELGTHTFYSSSETPVSWLDDIWMKIDNEGVANGTEGIVFASSDKYCVAQYMLGGTLLAYILQFELNWETNEVSPKYTFIELPGVSFTDTVTPV